MCWWRERCWTPRPARRNSSRATRFWQFMVDQDSGIATGLLSEPFVHGYPRRISVHHEAKKVESKSH